MPTGACGINCDVCRLNIDGLCSSCGSGTGLPVADAAICLRPFPRIPVYYLLWGGNEEFPAKFSILFDRSIDHHLPADAIWCISRVSFLGRVKVNVAPFPGLLFTQSRPL